MELSIAEFLMRQLAYEQLQTFWLGQWQGRRACSLGRISRCNCAAPPAAGAYWLC